jgi:adenylate cyclase, class 2
MKEIEVKARVSDLNSLRKKLEGLGCVLSEPLVQKDKIYLDKNITFPEIKSGVRVLRIRDSNGKIILTLKISEENELACLEKEMVVDNAEEANELLDKLGYHEVVRVNKKRQKCKLNGLKICLDKVEELGYFVEVEKMTDEDSSKVQEELFQFLETLGVSREDRVFQGYDTLMYKKLNE